MTITNEHSISAEEYSSADAANANTIMSATPVLQMHQQVIWTSKPQKVLQAGSSADQYLSLAQISG